MVPCHSSTNRRLMQSRIPERRDNPCRRFGGTCSSLVFDLLLKRFSSPRPQSLVSCLHRSKPSAANLKQRDSY